MRSIGTKLLAVAAASLALLPAHLQKAAAQGEAAPQAWLYGTWTGGLFPAPTNLSAQSCLSQPVVIFTRDVVLRAVITDQAYVQRIVETARTSGGTTEFRFAAAPPVQNSPLLGMAAPDTTALGFGCEDPDVLHVQRHTENEITFPGCADFPNPLLRCPMR